MTPLLIGGAVGLLVLAVRTRRVVPDAYLGDAYAARTAAARKRWNSLRAGRALYSTMSIRAKRRPV